MPLVTAHTVAELRHARDSHPGTLALVPTMGALHAGHLALVERARAEAAQVAVSIFVNPTQFAPGEDLAAYPRTLARDLDLLAEVGADIAFVPDAAVMYPRGFATEIQPGGPALAALEDRARPTHFAGVATVVAKLLLQSGADIAVFGEKDFQQLRVVTHTARDLDIPTRIVGHPTVREADGLALSSRNRYLSAEDRAKAPALFAVLTETAAGIRAGLAPNPALATASERLSAAGFEPDYVAFRDADTLQPPVPGESAPLRLLAAARLGTTRLLDNVPV